MLQNLGDNADLKDDLEHLLKTPIPDLSRKADVNTGSFPPRAKDFALPIALASYQHETKTSKLKLAFGLFVSL